MRGLVWTLLLALPARAGGLVLLQSVRPDFPVAAWRLTDLDGDGRAELLLIGVRGEVRTWTAEAGRLEVQPRGRLVLDDPSHSLLALADFLGEKSPQLMVLSPAGAVAYPVGPDGAFATTAVPLARRARFRWRTNEPVFAGVAQDVNGDGRPDLIVPGNEFSELWIQHKNGFRRAASIAIDIDRSDSTKASALSDRLTSSFQVPRLQISDVNGDGRRDLLVEVGHKRAFHMQRSDGSIPPQPDVVLDLDIFRDTTPKAVLRPGRTLAGSDRTRYLSRDLDGDGIPDHLIAHRRKVWIFHGNRKQPQFVEPTSILKVSDDVTLLMVTQLNDDKLPDLLLVKVQVPTFATLLLGVVRRLNVDIMALGYANRDGRSFERVPTWKSEITVRIPSILSVLKNPGAIFDRVEKVGRKFRLQRSADLDGDGLVETLLLSENRTRIDVWRGRDGVARGDGLQLDHALRHILFEDKNRHWDLDRILSFFASIAEQRTTHLTGGRKADASWRLRPAGRFDFLDYGLGNIDGRAGREVVLRYLPSESGATPVFDIVRFER